MVIDVGAPAEPSAVQLLREAMLAARIPTLSIEERAGKVTIELDREAAIALATSLTTLALGTGVVRGVVDLFRSGSRR